jgi:hypothetical protein
LPASDEVNLVFALTVAPAKIGTSHQVSVDASWADPIADVRRSISMFLLALLVDDPANVERTPIDEIAREQVVLQRAAADQKEAIRLDRAGRHAESRAHLHAASAYLMAAPSTPEIEERRLRIDALASFDADASYGETTRKQAIHEAHRDSRRQKRER